jgi:hypothetical protein
MSAATRVCSVVILTLLLPWTPASGQSVQAVVDQMYDALERHSDGVDNYTVVQSVMGFETVTYFEKEVVDGRPVFMVRETRGGGSAMSSEEMAFGDITALGSDLVDHGRYAGREQVDGREVHVIAIDDLTQLDFAAPSGPEEMEFVAKSGRIFVDAEMGIPRRMTFDGQATTPSGVHDVTTTVDLRDYREVESLLVPYLSVVSIEGIEAMIDPEMQAQYEEMRRQLESLPESQRAMFEQMMGAQMEQIERMMAGDDGPMTMEITVTEVRVNAGPPGADH